MDTYDLMTEYSKVCLARSKKYDGVDNYAFAFDWFTSEMGINLDELGLNKKQMKILNDRLEKLKKLTFGE